MKRLILTGFVFLSSVVGGMDFAIKPTLLNQSEFKDMRYNHVYPFLTIQNLGRLICANHQLSNEIKDIALYKDKKRAHQKIRIESWGNTLFKGLEIAIKSAWRCYSDSGCKPKVGLCFIDCWQPENVLQINERQLIGNWIENKIVPTTQDGGIIFKDTIAFSISPVCANYITLKQSNGSCDNFCICNDQEEKFNNIMSIFSIGVNDTLNKNDFDYFVTNNLKKPLVFVIDKGVLLNDSKANFLLKRFRRLKKQNKDIVGDCLAKLEGRITSIRAGAGWQTIKGVSAASLGESRTTITLPRFSNYVQLSGK